MFRGWYSKEQEKRCGSVVWEDIHGNQVLCTEIGDSCNWEDAQLVSSDLVRFVSRKSNGIFSFDINEHRYISDQSMYNPHYSD